MDATYSPGILCLFSLNRPHVHLVAVSNVRLLASEPQQGPLGVNLP